MDNKNIIIVDDSKTMRKRLEIVLNKEGFATKEFMNGKDTLDYLISVKNNLPSVVITDVSMPEMNGFELVEKIKNKFGNVIAVIVFTAFADEYSINEAFARGAVDYIEKPGKKQEIITRIKQALNVVNNEKKLIENEKRLKDIIGSIYAGIIIIDAETHNIVDVNPMAEKMIGFSRENIIGNICHKFICPSEKGKCPITDLGKTVDNSEKIILNSEGKEIPILKTVASTVINERKHLVESFLDISELKKIQNELQILSISDPLTGIYNRRHFFELFKKEFNRSLRLRKPLSFLMMDIDHFKNINDSYGHKVGDQALIHFTNIVLSLLRDYDIICRFGGEEFSIMCPETGIENACLIAERIREKVEKSPILFDELNISLTVCIGVSALLYDDNCADDVVKRADKALYKAKYSGRNKSCKHLVSND